ncbi:MAG: rhomboid family intramembrane serine protease [Xanthomonadales bacterium]|nr:rhomboid family intramembrane serine protease [Xanthomonadales bacterium]
MFVQLPVRRRAGPRWATPLVCAALSAAFLWVGTRPEGRQAALLLDWGALTGGPVAAETFHALWADGRWLRLFTALFLHADWAHLLGNLVFLLIFGLSAERAMGPWRFLALFLLGGAVANLATVFTIGGPERSLIGASGAVSAVIGAYLALFPRARLGVVLPLGLFLEFIRVPASLLIGVWAALQVGFAYIGPAFGTVAWSAHIAGFLFGILFATAARSAIARRLRHDRGF